VAVKLIHRHLMDDASAVESFIRERSSRSVSRTPTSSRSRLRSAQQPVPHRPGVPAGVSLAALCKFLSQAGRHLSIDHAAYLVYNALRGLEFAHDLTDESGEALGLVHRDINPQNILISIDGQVSLTDFGIAHIRKR